METLSTYTFFNRHLVEIFTACKKIIFAYKAIQPNGRRYNGVVDDVCK